MKNPIISVVMPVYNGEKYLREAIDSILNQSFSDFEFIIVNDGSTDRTEEIVFSYDDKRIVYIKNQENLNISKTLNKGIEIAKGKYIARMDDDDISLPTRFERQIDFLEKNKDVGVCDTWLKTFGDIEEDWAMPVSHEEKLVSLLFHSSIAHATVLMRKNILNGMSQLYKDSFSAAEDYELWTRLASVTKFAGIPEVLYKYRFHSEQTDNAKQLEIANKVRSNYIKTICPDITKKEIKQFIKIAHGLYVNKKTSLIITNKILKSNEQNNILDSTILKIYLDRYSVISHSNFKQNIIINFVKNVIKSIKKCFIVGAMKVFKL